MRLVRDLVIEQIVAGTQTPVALRLTSHPAPVSSVGVGFRANGRFEGPYLRRFFQWLTRATLVTFLVFDDHLLDHARGTL